MEKAAKLLEDRGIRPTRQRVAVARCVLRCRTHPSADEVLRCVRGCHPRISRASVYNALELFARKRLLKKRLLIGGRYVYDAVITEHHHFIDERSGAVFDIPSAACRVRLLKMPRGFEVRGLQLILHGRKKRK